jgi:aerobic carbon-monoxide dehydrogenase medium subunit
VKPAPFAYHRPSSRDEVDGLLAEFGGEAKLLAGGQSLVPILNMRLAAPAHVIDLNFLRDEPAEPVLDEGMLAFGPLVRQRAAERSPLVGEHLPLLAEVLQYVAHPAIRSRGTVAGSVAHADPAAELPALLVLLEGTVRVRGEDARREVGAGELFAGHLETTLRPGEWIEEVRLPAHDGGAFDEFARRQGDYALCGVAALAVDGGVALSFVGMGAVPERHVVAEAREAVAALEPEDDIHATADYRRWLAERLGERAARRALEA